ncbi:hypothetical protein [Jannaschia marina]|uniref:hypothetical protein n=1 Tax=Jannaschia marina TaxID=2741674 RepID=UPI0015CECB73|nr:hypothetical protein [Jannaschia marina]
MIRPVIVPLALGSALLPGLACAHAADAPGQAPFLGPWAASLLEGFRLGQILPWVAGCLAVTAAFLLVGHRMRRRRRALRLEIAGLRNGPRFSAVDAMCHAVWKGRTIEAARLARALEIARDTTEMDFTASHLREIARRADRLILPTNFYWMRDGLTRPERMVIFNATVSVLLADGPLTRADRAFLRTLTRGLGLRQDDLRDLARLVAT